MNWFKSLLFAFGCLAGMTMITCKSNTEQTEEGGVVDTRQRVLDKEAFAAGIKKSNAVVVDLRYPFEYEQSHIPEAINLNFFDPNFQRSILDLDRDKKIYLYGKNENTSDKAMQFLITNDFKHVYTLQGGYDTWNKVHATDQPQ
jgi:rhodanese-related sulfurtransferase